MHAKTPAKTPSAVVQIRVPCTDREPHWPPEDLIQYKLPSSHRLSAVMHSPRPFSASLRVWLVIPPVSTPSK